MSDLRRKIIDDLSGLVTALKEPSLCPTTDGWSGELTEKWGNIFSQLLESVRVGEFGPDASIPRAMDFDGIVQGEILERAAEVSNSLRELRRNA